MDITQTYYGDFTATDELPWTPATIFNVAHEIEFIYKDKVSEWPVTVELVNGWWVLYFVRPVSDEVYEQLEVTIDNRT